MSRESTIGCQNALAAEVPGMTQIWTQSGESYDKHQRSNGYFERVITSVFPGRPVCITSWLRIPVFTSINLRYSEVGSKVGPAFTSSKNIVLKQIL